MTPPDNFAHDTLADTNSQPAMGALPCDAHHHYYHYQSSAQYTLLARCCFALDQKEEALAALEKALFQDHFNEEALRMKKAGSAEGIEQSYAKHPPTDAAFCESVGTVQDEAGRLHDEAIAAGQDGSADAAIEQLQVALVRFPEHGNLLLTLGRYFHDRRDYEQARTYLQEAARISHKGHDAYHRAASHAHLERARMFAANGRPELALNDYAKALDLDRTNETAKAEMQALRDREELRN